MIRKIIVSLLVLLLLTGCEKSEVLPYTIVDKELVSKPFEIQSLLAYENDDTYLINIKIKSVPNMTGALSFNANEPIFLNKSTTGEDVFDIEFQKQYLEKYDKLTIAFWTTGNDHVDINISKEQFLSILESSKSIPKESNVINNMAERINTEPYQLEGSLFETNEMELNKLSLYRYNDNYVLGVNVKTKEGFDVCFFDAPNGDNIKTFAGPTTDEVEDYYIEIPKNVYDKQIEFGVSFFREGEDAQDYIFVHLDKMEIEGNFDGELTETNVEGEE